MFDREYIHDNGTIRATFRARSMTDSDGVNRWVTVDPDSITLHAVSILNVDLEVEQLPSLLREAIFDLVDYARDHHWYWQDLI